MRFYTPFAARNLKKETRSESRVRFQIKNDAYIR